MKKYIATALNNPATLPWLVIHQLRRWFPVDYRYFSSGFSLFPDQVTFINTKRCNFGCDMCSSDSPQITRRLSQDSEFRKSYQELTTKEYFKILDQLQKFMHPSIYITGGEPTLRPDVFDIVRYAKSKHMLTAMTTNGSLLTDNKIKEIFDSGLDFISISIDGPRNYHNKWRKYPLAFEKACSALRKMAEYKKKTGLTRPSLKIATIIDPEAISNSYYILRLAEHLGVDEVAFGNLMFYTQRVKKAQKKMKKAMKYMGEFMIGLEVGNDFDFKNPEFEEIKKFYQTAQSLSPKVKITFNPKVLDSKNFYNPQKYPLLSSCKSTYFTATVSPTGDVYHCQEYFVGNLRDKPFKEIWNSHKLKSFRAIKKRVQMPACYRCLEGQEIKF